MPGRIKRIWASLSRDIFVGDRLEKNLNTIRYAAMILTAAGLVMFGINIASGAYYVSLTSVAIVVAGLLILWCTAKRKRRAAMYITVAAIVTVFTYDIFFVRNEFAYLWTLLVPLAISYLFSVRAGILISVYFWLVFVLAFQTPLKAFVQDGYPEIILTRFPVLYLFHIALTSLVMIQYHKSILDQMDYDAKLQEAKEKAEREREAAERANAAKSDFLTNMSHEIRTPINAVLGMNELIQRETRQAKTLPSGSQAQLQSSFESIGEYADHIENAGKGLLSIINEILDLSRIESGRITIKEADYKLSSVLNDLSNMFLFKAREKGLDFTIDADETLPEDLYGDEYRVRQVVINILSNAVKYTDSGSIHFSIRMADHDKPAKGGLIRLLFSVRDTGIGIQREDMDKLFHKFERVDLQHNSTIEGAGLGLAITRELLGMMNGEIKVESDFGKGSVFTILIPQKVVGTEPVGNFKSKFEKNVLKAGKYQESFRAPGASILIVDDTQMNLLVAERLLRQTELQIDTVLSGMEALERTESKAYDLILMDQRMPGLNGTETLERIRAQENGQNHGTPVVCLTANAMTGARQQYLAEGFTDYLSKPIDGTVLEQMVRRLLPPEKILPARSSAPLPEKTMSAGCSALPAEEKKPAEEEHARDAYAPLKEAGIDPAAGLSYCSNDEEFYLSMLRNFAGDAEEREERIQGDYDREDWKDYGISVHALKSTSRMLGAKELSEMAAQLEKAAGNGQADEIRAGHETMMRKHRDIVQAIHRQIPEGAQPEPESEDTDGILEFFPDE